MDIHNTEAHKVQGKLHTAYVLHLHKTGTTCNHHNKYGPLLIQTLLAQTTVLDQLHTSSCTPPHSTHLHTPPHTFTHLHTPPHTFTHLHTPHTSTHLHTPSHTFTHLHTPPHTFTPTAIDHTLTYTQLTYTHNTPTYQWHSYGGNTLHGTTTTAASDATSIQLAAIAKLHHHTTHTHTDVH